MTCVIGGLHTNLTNSKSVYVISRWHLNKLQKHNVANCFRCNQEFNEDDVIATSTSNRYCYECAIVINLVTGKIDKDLHNDKLIPEVIHNIGSIAKKLEIHENISRLAVLLFNTAIKKTNYISKNKIGLACAAIFMAYKIKEQPFNDEILPVTKKTLQKNMYLLQKNLTTTDVHTLSKAIHELVNWT